MALSSPDISAPYTPETVAAIRRRAAAGQPARAIAYSLGWDVGRLARVARAHSIDLAIAALKAVEQEERVVTAPAPRPARVVPPGLKLIIAAMPMRMGEVVAVLSRGDGIGFISAKVISLEIGVLDVQTAIGAAQRAQRHLVQIEAPWRIESLKGLGGGYRLVAKATS